MNSEKREILTAGAANVEQCLMTYLRILFMLELREEIYSIQGSAQGLEQARAAILARERGDCAQPVGAVVLGHRIIERGGPPQQKDEDRDRKDPRKRQ